MVDYRLHSATCIRTEFWQLNKVSTDQILKFLLEYSSRTQTVGFYDWASYNSPLEDQSKLGVTVENSINSTKTKVTAEKRAKIRLVTDSEFILLLSTVLSQFMPLLSRFFSVRCTHWSRGPAVGKRLTWAIQFCPSSRHHRNNWLHEWNCYDFLGLIKLLEYENCTNFQKTLKFKIHLKLYK